MNYQKCIVRDPNICSSLVVVKGTRVPIRTILTSLADGDKVSDILTSFPSLTEESVWAVIAFAAASTEEDLPVLEAPAFA